MNVPCGILHRNEVAIFDPLRNMAAVLKIKHRDQTELFGLFSPVILGTDVKPSPGLLGG